MIWKIGIMRSPPPPRGGDGALFIERVMDDLGVLL